MNVIVKFPLLSALLVASLVFAQQQSWAVDAARPPGVTSTGDAASTGGPAILSCGTTFVRAAASDYEIGTGSTCKEAKANCQAKLDPVATSELLTQNYECPARCPNRSQSITTQTSSQPGYCGGQDRLRREWETLYPNTPLPSDDSGGSVLASCGWLTVAWGEITCSAY